MRSPILAIALSSEIGDFADEVRRVYLEFGRVFGAESLAGECHPPVDVYETDDAIEITVDLPGVTAAAVRVMSKRDSVLVVGEKSPRRGAAGPRESDFHSFHLVERGYGRFARVVRIGRACEMSKARASLAHGELRVSIPKMADRRGAVINIPVR